tara:strand:+ start:1568 stop:2461 length:894 start_codon:yes stop_codon:yes gene_type:complete
MKCIECGNSESTYDERLGEHTCDNCGLVIMLTPLEETSSMMMPGRDMGMIGRESVSRTKDLGSVIGAGQYGDKRIRALKRVERYNKKSDKYRSIIHMALSYYNPSQTMKEDAAYISNFLRERRFQYHASNAEMFGAAVAYATLRKHNVSVTVRQFCKTNGQEFKPFFKLLKKTMRALGDNIRPRQINIESEVQRILTDTLGSYDDDTYLMSECIEILYGIKEMFSDEAFTTTQVLAGIWLTARFNERSVTQRQLQRTQGVSEVTIRTAAARILRCLGMKRKQVVPEYYLQFKRKLII